MKLELIELKRCCCCLPLRYGLLTFGYIKLACVLLFIGFIINVSVEVSNGTYRLYRRNPTLQHTINGILLAILAVDASLTTIFLVGGHQKSSKLLRIFYIYSIVGTTVITLLFLGLNIYSIAMFIYYLAYNSNSRNLFFTMVETMSTLLLVVFALIGFQVYFILMIRSEINKLENYCKFRFSNIASEAQCTLENGTSQQNDGQIDQFQTEDSDQTIDDRTNENGTVEVHRE